MAMARCRRVGAMGEAHEPGMRQESHGALTNNDAVLSAVIDILKQDTTQQLPTQAPLRFERRYAARDERL